MIKEDKLDPDQRDFINTEINRTGNIWIQGFAGSGKSVMLIHALRTKLSGNPGLNVCVVVFTHSLIDMFKTGMKELGMSAVPVMTFHQFIKGTGSYDYIFCDEVQDLPEHVLASMQRRSSHVFVAGDSNQSIYENTVSSNDIGNILSARPFILSRIYRLTRSIMNAVSHLLPDLNIFSAKSDMTKVDVSVRLCKGDDKEEEVKFVWKLAKEATSEGNSAVVLLPKHDEIYEFIDMLLTSNGKTKWTKTLNSFGKPDYYNLNKHFLQHGIKAQYIGNSYGSFENAAENRHLIIMTYHSAKGMDFDNVYLPFMSNSTSFGKGDNKTLLMVALTRSKKNLHAKFIDF